MNHLQQIANRYAGIVSDPVEYVEQKHVIEGAQPHGFLVSVDLGKHQDFSFLSVNEIHAAERVWYARTKFQPEMGVLRRKRVMLHRFVELHRYRIGTSYTEVASSVRGVLEQLPYRPHAPALILDATGVGAGVVEMVTGLGLSPFAITITGGQEVTNRTAAGANVPKGVLASTMDAALADDRVQITTSGPAAKILRQEMMAFTAKQRASGNVAFEAGKASEHDDGVLSVALSIWFGENLRQPARFERVDFMSR